MLSRHEAALYAVAFAWVFVTPYIKVEESFTLHAVHDFLTHGYDQPQLFDHVEFPGAVPRSFVPAGLLSGIVFPFLSLGAQFNLWRSKLHVQILIRLVLATVNVTSLVVLLRSAQSMFGIKVARTSTWLMVTQFHLLYYSSRTLPNMLAFPFVQIAFAYLLENKSRAYERAVCIIGSTALIARFELLGLAGPVALNGIRRGTTSVGKLIVPACLFSTAAIATSIVVDQRLWQQPMLWPEGQSFYFNVIQGKSTNWGTSPWYTYFTVSLTRLLFPTWPVFPMLAIFIDRRARLIGIPALEFIGLLSLLGHKEWRFFVYVLPALNVCSAAGIESLQAMFSRRFKQGVYATVLALAVMSTLLTGYVSRYNYPGGVALSHVANNMPAAASSLSVHFDAGIAMNGASLFLHEHTNDAWYVTRANGTSEWTWDKREGLSERELAYFDVLVLGDEDGRDERTFERTHEVVERIPGFDGIDLKGLTKAGRPWIKMRDKAVVLQRRP